MYKQSEMYYLMWLYRSGILMLLLFLTTGIIQAKEVIGIYEKVKINHAGLVFKAKIDTGAKNSSLNSENINLINKNGKTWVKFDITNKAGESATIEKPLLRFVKIKRKKADTQERPSILLDICLGRILKTVEVNLVNRSNFNYQMLIGRSFLREDFIVDVSKSYTLEPDCK